MSDDKKTPAKPPSFRVISRDRFYVLPELEEMLMTEHPVLKPLEPSIGDPGKKLTAAPQSKQ